jgi:hypothetical protein
VTVSAEQQEVESEPQGLSAVVDEQAILNLPLNGRRFTDLAMLTSSATQDPRPNYATADMRIARRLFAKNGWKLELTAESFNLFKRLKTSQPEISDYRRRHDEQCRQLQHKNRYYPACYQVPTNFMQATHAYPRGGFNLRYG